MTLYVEYLGTNANKERDEGRVREWGRWRFFKTKREERGEKRGEKRDE